MTVGAAGVTRGREMPVESSQQPQSPRMVVVDLGETNPDHCSPMATILEQFTPWAQELRPGLHAFGAPGPSFYFGGEHALAGLVVRATADAVPSAPAGVGIADGMFSAGLAASCAVSGEGGAVLVVPSPQTRVFLSSFRLAVLLAEVSPLGGARGETGWSGAGVPASGVAGAAAAVADVESMLDVLGRLGIQTLGDLAAHDSADILGRFGRLGLLAHRLALGFDDRPAPCGPVQMTSAAEAEIDPPAHRVSAVAFVAKSLAGGMIERLARNGLDCVCVGVEAHTETGESIHREWRHEFRFTAAAIAGRVRWQLEGWRRSNDCPAGPVTFIRLTPCEVVPATGRQLGLWGEQRHDERAAKAFARVQGLLGAGAVRVPRLGGGRRPAELGLRQPMSQTNAGDADAEAGAGDGVGGAGPVDAPWPGRLPAPMPITVLATPVPVAVTDQSGASIAVGGRGEPSAAPWRLSFPGPDGRSHRVTATAQARFQLIVDDGSAHLCVVEGGQWRLEATYD